MKYFQYLWTAILGTTLLPAPPAGAIVVPNPLFSDGAVLQQGMRIPVFGTADEGETVTVSLNGTPLAHTITKNGQWQVTLPPMKAGGPVTLTIAGPRNTVTVGDVLIGEVYVCSGQSNMGFPLQEAATGADAIAKSDDPLLHILSVGRAVTETPQTTFRGQWQAADPKTVPGTSAVAYFFGRNLRRALNVPVGLIESSWGGTVAQAWTSRPALAGDPILQSLLTKYAADVQTYQAAVAAHEADATKPVPKADPAKTPNSPAMLYNGMIAPLIPYGIRGAIWYQGESNAGNAIQYATLFSAMIADWRKHWGEGDFPFLFVQLAPFNDKGQEPQESQWAELREVQRRTALTIPNTAMAVITDVGDRHNIHPTRKEPVGDRLARAALALVYKRNVESSGPIYRSLQVKEGRAILRFTHLGGGLAAVPAGPLTGFEIAGADRKYVTAQAQIVGDTVVVSSPLVPQPAAVRYGWENYPVVNLGSKAGLPASPFQTDPFPSSK